MDLEDFIVSNNVLPLGSLVFIVFCTNKRGWGWDNFLKEANTGHGLKFTKETWMRLYMQIVIPAIVAFIFIKGYYDTFSQKGTAVLVTWMCIGFAMLGLVGWFCFGTSKKRK